MIEIFTTNFLTDTKEDFKVNSHQEAQEKIKELEADGYTPTMHYTYKDNSESYFFVKER